MPCLQRRPSAIICEVPVLERKHTLEQRADLERIRTLRVISIIIIGFAAGMISGLLGIGGGIVLVPAMVYLLGMSQHRAHGTSLAAVVFVVFFNATFYFRGLDSEVQWLLMAAELAVGGVLGAIIGAKLCRISSARQLRRYFAIFIGLVALRMLGDAVNYYAHDGLELPGLALSTQGFWGTTLTLGVGLLTGIVSGLLGIGGGVVLVPALVLLLGFEQQLAQGISLAVIVPTSLSGSLIHYRHGNVRIPVWFWLTIGGIIGGLLGSRTAFNLDPMVLRGIFGILLIIVSVVMFRSRGPRQR